MIPRILAVVIAFLGLGFGISKIVETSQENSKQTGSIQSTISKARSQGQTRVTIPGPIVDYPGTELTLDEALQNYSVLSVEPIETNSYIFDSDTIRTVYKFRIIDAISQRNALFCPTCPAIRDVSSRVRPTLPNEFILELVGGTITLDGVEVTMTNTGKLKFEEGKKYLLVVSFTPGGMARLAAGPAGVFSLNNDDSLVVIGDAQQPIPSQIATRFSNHLSRLKRAINH